MAEHRIEISADAQVSKAQKDVKNLKAEIEATASGGKKASISLTGSFKMIETAIGNVKKVMSTVSFATMWIDAVTNIIRKVNEWREKIRQTKVEAEKLKNEVVFNEQMRGVDELAKRYQNLTKDIEDAGKAAQQNEQVASAALQATRLQEDAQLDLKMEQEIRSLDRNDPTYAAKVSEIRQRYSGAKNVLKANRDVEDAQAKEKAYGEQAYDEDVNAATFTANANSAQQKADEMKRKSRDWGYVRDAYMAKGKPARNMLLSQWIKGGGDATILKMIQNMTPEEIVQYAGEQEKAFGEKASAASSTAESFGRKAQDAAAKSKAAAALQQSQSGFIAAAQTRLQATGLASTTSQEDANTNIAKAAEEEEKRKAEERKKAAKKAQEEADLKAAQDLLETGGSKASSYRRQIQANNERIAATEFGVATGKTGNNAGAKVISELQRQNDELNELLSELLKKIDQSKRTVERANQRMRNAQGVDSTEGA